MIQHKLVLRSLPMGAVVAAALCLAIHARGQMLNGVVLPKKNQPSAAETFKVEIPDYATIPADKIDQTTDTFLDQQYKMRINLENQISTRKLPDYSKAEIIRMLGATGAAGETDYLIENINFRDTRSYPLFHSQWRGGYPARLVLGGFGNSANWAIYAVIGNHNQKVPFDRSQIDGFVDVLFTTERPKYAIMKLTDAQNAATDAAAKANFQMVIDACNKLQALELRNVHRGAAR